MSARKTPDRRQNRETKDVGEAETGPVVKPPAPRNLSDEILEAWDTFWDMQPLARRVSPADILPLMRMFQLYQIYVKTIDDFMLEPYVEGERGKLVAHPGWSIANAAMRQLIVLEKQFGVTPKARAELGITLDLPTTPGATGGGEDFTDEGDDGD